jgi:hypothetical protein
MVAVLRLLVRISGVGQVLMIHEQKAAVVCVWLWAWFCVYLLLDGAIHWVERPECNTWRL